MIEESIPPDQWPRTTPLEEFPEVPDALTEAVLAYLKNEGMQRPPLAAAKILTFIVQLHREGRKPFPVRHVVATYLDVATPTVDSVLGHRVMTGHLIMRDEVRRGGSKKRQTINKVRFYTPSDDLVKVVEEAEARYLATLATRAQIVAVVEAARAKRKKKKKNNKRKEPAGI
jgi:hypothetical protein